MKSITLNILLMFMLLGSELIAQEPLLEVGQWKHQSFNGSLVLEGIYRSQKTELISGYTEKPVTQKYLAQITLDSRSYIWHPNFCSINLNLNYNPGIKNEKFLIIPNRSETRTAEHLRFQSIFYKGRPFSFNTYFNINHSYINREYASSMESVHRDIGGGISYRNQIVPVSLNYVNSDWQQNELLTKRKFSNLHENLRIDINKSFGKQDKHKISYSYDDYNRRYGDSEQISNTINSIRMQNSLQFSKNRKNSWNSMFLFYQQEGHQEYDRYQINENVIFELPRAVKFKNTYRYAGYKQSLVETKQHNFASTLEHQLFKSLNSRVYFEYINLNHSVYNEYTNRLGMAVRYDKKIPGGRLSLSHEYCRRYDKRNGESSVLNIFREEISIEDGTIALLDNMNINVPSIRIKDVNGTIIYQQYIDFILVERDGYVEIQRLPGGLILNGQTVYVDYEVLKSASFDYASNSNSFNARMSLFGRLLETYFRFRDLNYGQIVKADDKILKTVNQKVVGLRLNKNIFTVGAEVDDYKSNVVPYQSYRYYFNVNKNFFNRVSVLVNANMRKYRINMEQEKQEFADLSGRLIYYLGMYSRISFEGGYRFQDGRGIDLRLGNSRMEFSTRFRDVYFSLGIEMYRRNFSGEKINYQGGYVKVERKF